MNARMELVMGARVGYWLALSFALLLGLAGYVGHAAGVMA